MSSVDDLRRYYRELGVLSSMERRVTWYLAAADRIGEADLPGGVDGVYRYSLALIPWVTVEP